MARLSRHVRLIYLVALFQLLGGPAVLCGVIGLARLASDRQLTLAEHAARAVERAAGRDVTEVAHAAVIAMPVVTDAPEPAVPPAGQTREEGKPKWSGVIHVFEPVFVGASCRTQKRGMGETLLAADGASAPLLRPPKEV